MERVNAVVLAVMSAAVADAASRNDRDVAVLADEELVEDRLFVAGFADDDRDVAGFVLCAVLDVDVDALAVLTRLDLDVRGRVPCLARSVVPYVESAYGERIEFGDFL